MQSIVTLPHFSGRNSHFFTRAAIIVISVLLLSLAVYELSLSHLIMLGIFSAGVLAIIDKMERIKPSGQPHSLQPSSRNTFDGGTFKHQEVVKRKNTTRSVVYDGGSFERSLNF